MDGSSLVVLHAALIAYFEPLRMAAQARDTRESPACSLALSPGRLFDTCCLFPCAGLFQRRSITAGIGCDHVDLQAAIDRGITVAEVT